jgi:hypothetical protein
MEISEILKLGGQLGLSGALLAYIAWIESNNRRDRNRRDELHIAFHRERLEADKDETESRNRLATALSSLATIITGGNRPNV